MTIGIDIRLIGKKRTGDETVFFYLTKNLLKIDTENEYLLFTDIDDPLSLGVILGRLECIGQTNVKMVSLKGRNRFIWNLITLPFYLFRHHVDVYHTQYILPFIVPRWTKVVTHIHDVSFQAHPELIAWSDRFFLGLLLPGSLRRAALIAVPSAFTQAEVVRYYHIPVEKIVVIPNALPDTFLENMRPDDEAVRTKYGLPERYLVYVGTLQPRKNLPFLIRAVAELRKKDPDIKLVLVGNRTAYHFDQAIDTALAETSMQEGVVFPGFVDEKDLPTVLRMAQVFVYPSLYEGFGIPLLEAMSQRVPVAASDIPALREVAGEAAAYFDPKSVASCTETLYTLVIQTEEASRLVREGEKRLVLFSWQKSAQALLSAYEQLTFR